MKWKNLLIFFLLWVMTPPLFSVQEKEEVKITLTHTENALKSDPEFTCQGTIHAYITFPKAIVGKHKLEGLWTLPNGTVNQHAKINISFPAPGSRNVYLYLSFEEEGGLLGLTKDETSPQQNKENEVYNGEWTLTVQLDGVVKAERLFEMKCTNL